MGLKIRQLLILELLTATLLFFAGATMNNIPNPPKEEPKQKAEVVAIEAEAVNATTSPYESEVKEYFKDTPVLARIAYCESKFQQYDKEGDVLRGGLSPKDIGIMQVNEYYHGIAARKLGFDIYEVEGNLGYAKWLYKKEGTKPWASSSKCWTKYEEIAKK